MSERVYEAQAGGLPVLHAITTRPHPPTAGEIAKDLDVDVKQVRQTLARLYRSGYVTRRVRETGGLGGNPYEYEVYKPERDTQ